MRDEMMDVLFLIILLAITVACGYAVILREQRSTNFYVQEYLSDKNTKSVEGFVIPTYGDYNGTLSIGDAILVSQIQDQYMPQPRVIANDENTDNVVITSVEHGKGGLDEAAFTKMKAYLTASKGERFVISYKSQFDTSDSEDKANDVFYIKKVK